jgi:hypothetical protein
MTISQVNAGLVSTTQSTGRFFMPGAKEFAGSLNLGQILKGKVLRQYDGNRYLVNFDGQERVVDSSLPLRTGELLHGRVVAIGDRVEMQRVYSDNEAAAATPPLDAAESLRTFGLNTRDAQLNSILERYQARLSEAERATLVRAARNAADPTAMTQLGVFLSKLGITQSDELLQMLYARLKGTTDQVDTHNEWQALPRLEVATNQAAGAQSAAVRQLADIVSRAAGVSSDPTDDSTADSPQAAPTLTADDNNNRAVQPTGFRPNQDDGEAANRMTQWLLNAQTGGSVMHRLGTLPLLLGGRLIEVDVAMFEQRREAVQKSQAQHRQLVFTLQTEHLGRVEVVARVVGDRVRVSVATDNENNTSVAASHVQALKTSLAEAGWTTDEVSYETRTVDARTGAVSSVVEHVVSLDSMNRLI